MFRFYPRSSVARLFLPIAGLLAASVLAALALSWQTYDLSLRRHQEQDIRRTLEMAANLIRGRQEDLSDLRHDSILYLRSVLRNQSAQFMAFMESERFMEKSGLISRADAQRTVLEAAKLASARAEVNVFICNTDFQGLAHSDHDLTGADWRGLKGIDGPGALEKAAALAKRDGSDTLTLWWPSGNNPSGTKHLARIVSFPDWGWYVGVSIDYGRIDNRAAQERNEIIHGITDSLSGFRLGQGGGMFVIEGREASVLLLPRGVSKQELTSAASKLPEGGDGPPAIIERPGPDGNFAVYALDLPEMNWRIGLVARESDLSRNIRALAGSMAAVFAALAVFGIAAAWLLARKTTAPSREMTSIVSGIRFARGATPGDLEQLRALASGTPGEAGVLATAWADALEAMNASLESLREASKTSENNARELDGSKAELEQLNSDLETRVRLRTSALEAANLRLKSSEERYRGLFMDSPVPFLEMDCSPLASRPGFTGKARLLDANPSALQLFEAVSKAVLGEKILRAPRAGITASLAAMLEKCPDGPLPLSAEVIHRKNDGSPLTLMLSVRPLPGHEKTLDRVLVSLQDITLIREAEERLREANEHALSASKAKSEFLANMSHELRTPISAILGLAELSTRTNEPAKFKKQLGMIAESARTLLAIIGDVLDLSRVESGKLALEEVPFEPRKVVDKALRPLGTTCADKGLELFVDMPEDLPEVLTGDALRLGQIISNLAGNAVKFTSEGYVRVSARVAESLKNAVTLQFSVSDTGPGIDPEQLETIFESFRQADSSLSKNHQGTGLGLAICRELTALMGGEVWVESRPGLGSTFHFTAVFRPGGQISPLGNPLPETLPEEVARDDVQPATEAPAPGSYGSARVLIVEDNPVNMHVFMEYLGLLGLDAVTAEDGVKALEVLSSTPVEFVFMDVQMPRMDGVEAVRRIRAGECGERASRLPVVALTAYAMSGDRQRFLDAGMTDYLPKPIGLDAIRAVLTRYMPGQVSTLSMAVEGEDEAVQSALEPLMAEFIDYVRKRTDEAAGFLEAGEKAEAAKAAHDVKGSSMAFGVDKVNKAGARLEAAVKADDEPGAAEALREVYEALAELEAPASPRSMA